MELKEPFIAYENFLTTHIIISCYVSQGSIIGPLLFVVYVNDLNKASDVLGPIMFADDANLVLIPSEYKKPF